MSPEKFNLIWGSGHSFDRAILPETVALIKRWELFKPRRYVDGKREDGSPVWSIGWGHSEDGDIEPKKIPEDMVLTLEQADAILDKDIARKAHFVNVRVTAPVTSYMRGSLTSFVFQYGNGRVDNTPVIGLINEGEYIKAACAMLDRYDRQDGTLDDGLRLRRASEIGLYMTRK